jgi:hypothetical protein
MIYRYVALTVPQGGRGALVKSKMFSATSIAIDGIKIQPPAYAKLKVIFWTIERNDSAATARASTLYEVLNTFIVAAIIGPISQRERAMAEPRFEFLNNNALPSVKDLIIFDRGYPSF